MVEVLFPLTLTRNELAIFQALYTSMGDWRTTRDLCEMTIGWPHTALKTHVCRMRTKLLGTTWAIRTRRGYGYRLVDTIAHLVPAG